MNKKEGVNKKTFNENYMGLSQTKNILGLFSLLIILHHIAIKMPAHTVNILLPFKSIGYLFVSYFFFCSGYGLYKSFISKTDYLEGFLSKHIIPIAISFFVTDLLFQFARLSRGEPGFPASTYSWFIFVIVALYCAFYFCFKHIKKSPEIVLLCLTLLYCLLCRLLYVETYLYNSIIAFPIGIFFAKYDEKICSLTKKHWLPVFLITTIILALLLIICLDERRHYTDFHTIMQIISTIFFCLTITFLSMKVKFENKVFSFLGGMTLEIYLVHVLFVEIFAAKFIGYLEPIFYIKNPILYSAAIFILTIPLAFGVKLLRIKLPQFIIGKSYTQYIGKFLKRLLKIIIILFVLAAGYFSITSHIKTKKSAESIKKYSDDFISYTNINGKNMASYITGEGEDTILILGDLEDPSPTLSLRPLADHLAENYKVIVIDYFGQGFSDNTKEERSVENIVSELHSFVTQNKLADKGDKDNEGVSESDSSFILMSIAASGLYAASYLNNYPEEVKALIGFDMITPALISEYYDNADFTEKQSYLVAKMYENQKRLLHKFMSISGFIRMELVMYEQLFATDVMSNYFDVVEEKLIARRYRKEEVESMANLCRGARNMDFARLPSNLPVLLMTRQKEMLDSYTKMITDSSIQSCVKMTNENYQLIYRPLSIVTQINEFLGKN